MKGNKNKLVTKMCFFWKKFFPFEIRINTLALVQKFEVQLTFYNFVYVHLKECWWIFHKVYRHFGGGFGGFFLSSNQWDFFLREGYWTVYLIGVLIVPEPYSIGYVYGPCAPCVVVQRKPSVISVDCFD